MSPQSVAAGEKLFRIIFSVHTLQSLVTSTLHGQMKMRTEFFHRCQPFHKFFSHDPRFQRAQTNPFDSIYRRDPSDHIQQIFIFQISPVRIQMNTSQDDFFITTHCQTFCLCFNIFDLPASYPSSCIRNNTIGTELIASILDLHICTGMLCCVGQAQFLICVFSCQIMDMGSIMFFLPCL